MTATLWRPGKRLQCSPAFGIISRNTRVGRIRLRHRNHSRAAIDLASGASDFLIACALAIDYLLVS